MKSKIIYLILPILCFTTTGCLRTYYPAVYQTSPQPLVYEDQDSTSHFVNAAVTVADGKYENESAYLLSGSYTTVITRDYTNFNSRFYGYTGWYNVSGINTKFDGTKSVFGLGGEINGSLNFKIGNFKLGIGASAGVAGELGGYYNFVKDAAGENLIKDDRKIVFITFSAYPVLAMQISDNSILSLQMSVGIPGFISPLLTYNNNGMVYWLSFLSGEHGDENSVLHRVVLGFMIDINKL